LQLIHLKTLENIIPFLLLGVFVYYVFFNPKKSIINPVERNFKKLIFIGPIVGFYNGFFGPGTGSIWSVALMRFLGMDIKEATMYTKPLNFVGNIASLIVFLFSGKIYFIGALSMGIGSFIGGKVGAIFVVYKNSSIIRTIFIAMMFFSIMSLFWKNYF
jgi:hypothetical protein